jgi:hypothetical protein
MSIESSLSAESRVGVAAWQMLEHIGDHCLEKHLDEIRRSSLLAGKHRLAEEARAWLEFSRATTTFHERAAKGKNPL